jgi:hypothetical protein
VVLPRVEEVERPKPNPEVRQSEQQGRDLRAHYRELRRQRQQERRQEHYRKVRERGPQRRCKAYTPVEEAAGHVMACIGVAPSMRLTRAAIVQALETHGGELAAAVNALVAKWKDYATLDYPRKFMYKPIGFFGGNHWQDESRWGLDHDRMAEAMQASIGTHKAPPAPVDFAALSAKIANLLGGRTPDDFEEEDDDESQVAEQRQAGY